MRSFDNVRIVRNKTHFAVYRGVVLVGVAGTFAGAWELSKATIIGAL